MRYLVWLADDGEDNAREITARDEEDAAEAAESGWQRSEDWAAVSDTPGSVSAPKPDPQNPDHKWHWMMDWLRDQYLPAAQAWAWKRAEEAWNELQKELAPKEPQR